MDPSVITGPDRDMREKADAAREKKERGETLNRKEAGILGAEGAMEKGARDEKRAAREGKLDEYREEHATSSWMRGDDTRAPSVGKDDEAKERRLREKQERGETLSREESGFLGGIARAKDAGKE